MEWIMGIGFLFVLWVAIWPVPEEDEKEKEEQRFDSPHNVFWFPLGETAETGTVLFAVVQCTDNES